MTTEIDLVPVRRDAQGNVREWRVERTGAQLCAPTPAPIEAPPLPAPRTTAHLDGTYSDRARGFSIATWQLSTVTGLAAWLLTSGLLTYPLLSITGLLWAVSGYLITWLAAYLVHTLASPEGVDLFNAVQFWSYLRREQRHRHQGRTAVRPPSDRTQP